MQDFIICLIGSVDTSIRGKFAYVDTSADDFSERKQDPTETHTVTNVDLARELLKAVDKTADNMLDIATNPYSTCTTGTQIGMTIARVKLLDAIEPIRKQIEEVNNACQ